MTFHVGQKVVCVDASHAVTNLVKGAVYTVEDAYDIYVVLDGVYPNSPRRGWFKKRFRPAVDKPDAVEQFRQMCRDVEREARIPVRAPARETEKSKP